MTTSLKSLGPVVEAGKAATVAVLCVLMAVFSLMIGFYAGFTRKIVPKD